MVNLHCKKHTIESAKKDFSIVCKTIDEIKKNNKIPKRKTRTITFEIVFRKYKSGKLSEKEFKRFLARFCSSQYLQGFIDGHMKAKCVKTQEKEEKNGN